LNKVKSRYAEMPDPSLTLKENNMENLVSIIIPAYNCSSYISEAIESVLSQSYNDFEIIVINDGSTDNTEKVLSEYIANKVIKYIIQNNRGPAAARNAGIKLSKGSFIAFLDADDIWKPSYLEKLIKKFEDDSSIGFVYSSCYFVDKNRSIIHNYKRKVDFYNGNVTLPLFCKFFLTSSIIAKKKCFDAVGLFNEKLLVGEDYEFLLRLSCQYEAEYVEEKLWERRVLPTSLSRKDYKMDYRNDIKTLTDFIRTHQEFHKKNRSIIKNRLSEINYNYAYNCLKHGEKWLALKLSFRSLGYRFNFASIKNIIKLFIPSVIIKKLMN